MMAKQLMTKDCHIGLVEDHAGHLVHQPCGIGRA